MFCGECGAKLDKNTEFCGECGAKTTLNKEEVITKSPEKEKRPSNSKKRRTLILVLIGVGLLVGTHLFLSALTKPEKIAQSFCNSLKNGKYAELYDNLQLPKSDFITKDKFALMFEEELDFDIESCTVKESSSGDDFINYNLVVTDDDNEETMSIKVMKTGNSKYLLYEEWLIEADSMYTEEWQISVPKSSKVFVDNIEIKDKEEGLSYSGKDIYTVKNVLAVPYNVKVTNVLMEDYEEEHTPTYSTSITMELKEDLDLNTEDILLGLYEVALIGKDINDIKNLIDDDYLDDAKELTENIRNTVDSSISWLYDVETYRNIQITDVELGTPTLEDDNEVNVRVTYYVAYEYKYIDEEEFEDKKSYYYLTLGFKSVDGNWVLSNKY